MIRVNQTPAPDGPAAGVNRDVYSALRCLEKALPVGGTIPPESWASLTLPRFVRSLALGRGDSVLIFDQFEEVLTTGPYEFDAKREFFNQLGSLLRSPDLHAIFSMREEFVAALEPYLRKIPGALDTRFRLELLGHADATRRSSGRSRGRPCPTVTEEAADLLVRDLSTVRVRRWGARSSRCRGRSWSRCTSRSSATASGS